MELGALPVRLLAVHLIEFAKKLLAPSDVQGPGARRGAPTRLGLLGSAGQSPAAWGYFVLREAGVPWANLHDVYRLSASSRLVLDDKEGAEALELIIGDRLSEVEQSMQFPHDVNTINNSIDELAQWFPGSTAASLKQRLIRILEVLRPEVAAHIKTATVQQQNALGSVGAIGLQNQLKAGPTNQMITDGIAHVRNSLAGKMTRPSYGGDTPLVLGVPTNR